MNPQVISLLAHWYMTLKKKSAQKQKDSPQNEENPINEEVPKNKDNLNADGGHKCSL